MIRFAVVLYLVSFASAIVLNITMVGNPILRQISEQISEQDIPQYMNLALDMTETMCAVGGVGIAGPQIGMMMMMMCIIT